MVQIYEKIVLYAKEKRKIYNMFLFNTHLLEEDIVVWLIFKLLIIKFLCV